MGKLTELQKLFNGFKVDVWLAFDSNKEISRFDIYEKIDRFNAKLLYLLREEAVDVYTLDKTMPKKATIRFIPGKAVPLSVLEEKE